MRCIHRGPLLEDVDVDVGGGEGAQVHDAKTAMVVEVVAGVGDVEQRINVEKGSIYTRQQSKFEDSQLKSVLKNGAVDQAPNAYLYTCRDKRVVRLTRLET